MAMNAAKMTKDRNVKSKKENEVKNQVRLKEVMINAKEVKNAKIVVVEIEMARETNQ